LLIDIEIHAFRGMVSVQEALPLEHSAAQKNSAKRENYDLTQKSDDDSSEARSPIIAVLQRAERQSRS
jgi:hypothetical protein